MGGRCGGKLGKFKPFLKVDRGILVIDVVYEAIVDYLFFVVLSFHFKINQSN